MSDPSRPKMPRLTRTGPVRNWDGLFGSPREAAGADGQPAPGPRSPASAVSRGVDMGYRVIEEYMRQGEAFARSNGSSRWAGGPPTADPRKLTERMVEYASDLAAAWLEFVQTTMPPAASAPGTPPRATDPGGFDIGRSPRPRGEPDTPRPETQTPAVPWRTSIEIASKRRVEVTVHLEPDGAVSLHAHDLRARDGDVPRIRDIIVALSAPDHRVLLRISVPDDQPAALYTGVIVEDESNLPKGTLSVRVFE